MKTLYLGLVASGIVIFTLTYLLFVPTSTVLSWDVSKIANATASKYGIFSHETDWHVHIASDGKIHPSTNTHEIDENSIFSCSFSVIPNDARDHFAYLAIFRNNNTGYVVALDDSTGQVVDAKPVPYGSAVCGP
ncbi:MAG TPA: hypothetical protein VFW99_01020 [Candidatus Nitrosotalea sp.]|nr:hypothetical protein [Candidatus Nitrosotalea sp.]